MRGQVGVIGVLVCSAVTFGALATFAFLFSSPRWLSDTSVTLPSLFSTSYTEWFDNLSFLPQVEARIEAEGEHREVGGTCKSVDESVCSAGVGGTGDGMDIDVEVGNGLMTSEDSSKALLADGKPRCFVRGDTGVDGARTGWCLPNVFHMGVSKCGEVISFDGACGVCRTRATLTYSDGCAHRRVHC